MYTLGTAQIKWIASQGDDQLKDALNNKLLAFVGSPADRLAQGSDQIGLNGYVVFFELTQPGVVTLYGTVQNFGVWSWDTVNAFVITGSAYILQTLYAASGFTTAIVAVQRGDTVGMQNALKADGVFYYNKELNILFIFNGSTGLWTSIGEGGGGGGTAMAPGAIFGFANSLTVPTGFLRCDGSSIAIADYPALFSAIGFVYGGSGTHFNLPLIDNSIICP